MKAGTKDIRISNPTRREYASKQKALLTPETYNCPETVEFSPIIMKICFEAFFQPYVQSVGNGFCLESCSPKVRFVIFSSFVTIFSSVCCYLNSRTLPPSCSLRHLPSSEGRRCFRRSVAKSDNGVLKMNIAQFHNRKIDDC